MKERKGKKKKEEDSGGHQYNRKIVRIKVKENIRLKILRRKWNGSVT